MKTSLAALSLLLALTGCQDKGESIQAVTNSHVIHIRVHPDNAVVSVHEPQSAFAAVSERDGPLAVFRLPEGTYVYRVEAPGYTLYNGSFSIPQNRNLEVWLDQR